MATLPVFAPPASLEELQGSGELNITPQGIAGTRKARVLQSELNHAIAFLLGTIVRTDENEIVNTAQPWPGVVGVLVESIRATPHGKSGLSSWESEVLPHDYYMLDINYKSAEYQKLSDDKEKPENEDYLIQEVDYSCETIIIPAKVTDTNAATETTTREVKAYVRLPKIEYTVTIPKVRRPNFELIQELNGKINTETVFGGAAGTVLFDGPKLSNTISSLNDPAWKFVMKFIYNKHGWNKTLHPETLKRMDAVPVDGGTSRMYETGNLKRLWTREES